MLFVPLSVNENTPHTPARRQGSSKISVSGLGIAETVLKHSLPVVQDAVRAVLDNPFRSE
jgi:hypothetical protein